MSDPIELLAKQIAIMHDRLALLEQRHERQHRMGTVANIDATNHKIRMQIGGTAEKPMLSPWINYSQIAGARKSHTMPSMGQQMMLYSPDGEFENALSIVHGWSDANPSPSNSATTDVDTRGKSVWIQKDGDVQQQVAKASWRITLAQIFHRVGDSRDGSDALQQQTNPQPPNPSDTVHFHQIEQTVGILASVANGLHTHAINALKGIISSVQNGLHTHTIDPIKGIISSVQNGAHTIGIDPVNGITHTSIANILSQATKTILSKALSVHHVGNTDVQGDLNITQNLAAQGISAGFGFASGIIRTGMSGATGEFSETGEEDDPFAPPIPNPPPSDFPTGNSKLAGGIGTDFINVSGLASVGSLNSVGNAIVGEELVVEGGAQITGLVALVSLPTFASDEAAGVGGVLSGYLYKDISGQIFCKV